MSTEPGDLFDEAHDLIERARRSQRDEPRRSAIQAAYYACHHAADRRHGEAVHWRDPEGTAQHRDLIATVEKLDPGTGGRLRELYDARLLAHYNLKHECTSEWFEDRIAHLYALEESLREGS